VADLAAYAVPAHAEVLVVTQLLELPRDLGLPRASNFVVVEPRVDGLFDSWSEGDRARFIGLDALPRPETSPVLRLRFERVFVPERAPLIAALSAFEDWVTPLATDQELAEFRAIREKYLSEGSLGWVTVVAATRFMSPSDFADDLEGRTAILGEQLDVSLAVLNDFIVSLSLARHDPSVVPVARGDLPFLCPVLIESAPMPAGEREGTYTAHLIHNNTRIHYGEPHDELDEADRRAAELARSDYHGNQPFFLFYELMQQAIGQSNEARYRATVLSVGTAVEVFLASVIRQAGVALGMPVAEIDRVLELPLRNIVVAHLPRFIGRPVDVTNVADPLGRWWAGGYRTRNAVAHQGHTPSKEEINEALAGASAVVHDVRMSLLGDERTIPVSESIQWGSVDDR
jgi:hypothetical protein